MRSCGSSTNRMKAAYYFIFLWLAACTNRNSVEPAPASDTTSYTSNDTVSEVRLKVSSKPVASYFVPINDPKLGYKFGVAIYETPLTFRYLMRMQYEGMRVTDTLKIPNFGIPPVVKIKQGNDKVSCIIGFLDQKKEFKEYKMLTLKGNQMKLIVLKKYSVGRYRNTYE